MAKTPKPTIFENAIHKVLPGTALSMYKKRVAYMAATGAYESTRSGNRPFNTFTSFSTSPNTRADSFELQTLRNQSRFLNMTGMGSAYSNRLTDLAIGRGLNFRAGIDSEYLGKGDAETKRINQELTRLWRVFWNGENGNVERMYSGGYFQALTFKSMLEGGDNVIIPAKTKVRNSHRFPFALKSYESELISTPYNQSNNDTFVDGFQRNDQGVPVRTYIAKSIGKYGTDTAYTNADNWESRDIFGKTGIRQVFHVKNLTQDRPGAIRGIPFLTPANGMIIDHNEFADAIVKTAKAQAVFAVIAKGGSGGQKFAKAPGNNQTPGTSD